MRLVEVAVRSGDHPADLNLGGRPARTFRADPSHRQITLQQLQPVRHRLMMSRHNRRLRAHVEDHRQRRHKFRGRKRQTTAVYESPGRLGCLLGFGRKEVSVGFEPPAAAPTCAVR